MGDHNISKQIELNSIEKSLCGRLEEAKQCTNVKFNLINRIMAVTTRATSIKLMRFDVQPPNNI